MRERGGRIDDVMSEEEGSKDGPRRERIWGAPPPPYSLSLSPACSSKSPKLSLTAQKKQHQGNKKSEQLLQRYRKIRCLKAIIHDMISPICIVIVTKLS